jgi:hypothetical protein
LRMLSSGSGPTTLRTFENVEFLAGSLFEVLEFLEVHGASGDHLHTPQRRHCSNNPALTLELEREGLKRRARLRL